MKTIEELEAELETVTRERDLSLFAWESAGMQGRTAQSAMLELTRQLEEARETILALTTAKAEADLEIAILTTALDERDLEAERSLEQYDRLVHQLADAMDGSTHWQVMCKRETEEVERLQVACHAWAEDMREAGRLCEQAGNEMPLDAVRRFVSSKTAIVDMLEDRLSEARSEVDRLTDERDQLLVRVANQDAELRATREAYNGARTDVPALIARVRELEAECERLKTFAAQNFSAMIRQEAEQMRAYGLSYEGVRKVLHEYNDGEISFGKLMDLIRAAARAMAEDMQK